MRSLLFTPANNPRRMDKALTLHADAVIVDLEDACPISEKGSARAHVVTALQRPRHCLGYVRINALSTEFAHDDICAVVRRGTDGIMLPKVESPDQIKTVDWLIAVLERQQGLPAGAIDLIPLIETGTGLVNAEAIGRAVPRIKRLAFGAADFTFDLGLRWSREETELLPFRGSLALASRAAGIEPPIDLAWIRTDDREGFMNSVRWGRTLGFQGKLCIHPDQITAINEAFAPAPDEVAHAQRVVDAFQRQEAHGSAAFILDGTLIDYALLAKARRVLDTARRIAAGDRRA